ncbi:hypothetical protein PUV54_03170 [Hyphococcus flavus]|uniref:Uncharacterized protein n=1 Tax=Hyphococcus flavus TaxID=1866326 RepID=A0AAE9ZG91_9PROT|nr:hypothetical protein [Hyphococcus flavus]WDI32192.1 hypothetical protein PUV54_03170 [Hyphococcus flavus]
MLLRRITEHVKAQNWTAVALDFVIVVVGVFIGIQVSNWNDAREQRAQEELYLQRLAQDFDVIIDRLESGLRASRASVVSGQMLLDYIDASQQQTEGPTKEDAMNALIRIGASAAPTGPSATFVEMVSTGDLSIIRDEALRDALFEYDLVASSNRDSWQVLRQNIIEEQRTVFSYYEADFEITPEQLSFQVTGFDHDRFLSDDAIPPAIGVIAGVSINENQLLSQQLEKARDVRNHITLEND